MCIDSNVPPPDDFDWVENDDDNDEDVEHDLGWDAAEGVTVRNRIVQRFEWKAFIYLNQHLNHLVEKIPLLQTWKPKKVWFKVNISKSAI